MKILNIIHAQSVGGVDQVFRYYSEALIQNGNDVALVISDNGNDDYQISGLKKIYKLKNLTPILDIIHLFFIIQTFKPQIIICHSLRPMGWMKWLKHLTPAKTIAVNHGITYKKSLNCEYVFSINEQIKNMVVKDGKKAEKSIFIPNMIKIDHVFYEKKFHSPITIGMFGRIEPRKGFDVLIRAVSLLKEQGINLKLILGGFSVENHPFNEETLKSLAKEYQIFENTEFVGIVKDKKKFFDQIDIFCVPSREEPFGMVIIESFLHSTPVISSDSEGAKLITTNGKDALLFPIDDHIALAEKIKLLINNKALANDITKNAFEKVKEKYSLEVIGKMIQAELDKMVEK